MCLLHHGSFMLSLTGVVDSQVSEGSFGSKQFLLKTSDGLTKYANNIQATSVYDIHPSFLRCCFWEIVSY